VKEEYMKICKRCKGTGTVWLEGSIHGEDDCPDCTSFIIDEEIQSKMPNKSKTFIQKSKLETIVWILGIILFLVITLGESFRWW
jgi:hypothetical protein